jgi:hypothetical protein
MQWGVGAMRQSPLRCLQPTYGHAIHVCSFASCTAGLQRMPAQCKVAVRSQIHVYMVFSCCTLQSDPDKGLAHLHEAVNIREVAVS